MSRPVRSDMPASFAHSGNDSTRSRSSLAAVSASHH
jgi:hypothetical protein